MTTDRPYRRRYTEDQAVRELADCAGGQFASEVVEAFLVVLEEEGILSAEQVREHVQVVRSTTPK